MSKQIEPHVLQFYQPKKLLGSGAYGHVWKVQQKSTKSIFALKKIFDAFQNSTDAQRTYRQISLLHQMEHKNIVKLHKVINLKQKRSLFSFLVYGIRFTFYSRVFYIENFRQSMLTPTHITFVIYQVLKALKYIHSAQLIHRDLKPSNILINSDCQIKLCDFGLARSLAHQEHEQNILSEEVATRWYRSPQMLLSSTDYSKPTDIWSVGCIVAQLLIGQPIFQGASTLNQLQKIIQFTGIPSKYTIDSLKSEIAQNIINNLTARKKSTKQYFRNLGPQNIQLINMTIKMLDFNPSKRPNVEQLLKNYIFQQFESQNYQQNQVCQKFIIPQIDDNIKLTLQEYRKIIYKDIERRYPQFNDAARIKSFYSIQKTQKNKSLMEKNRKKSIQNNNSLHHQSLIHKSLPKTSQTISSIKKSSIKRQKIKYLPQVSSQNTTQYLKQKFSKIQKSIKQEQKVLKQVKQPVKFSKQPQQFVKQSVKNYNQIKNQENQQPKKNDKILIEKVQKIKKPKKLQKQKQQKQNKNIIIKHLSPQKQRQKITFFRVEQKASVYKQQLKRIKSSKNLIKNKITKPKFQKTLNRTKQVYC